MRTLQDRLDESANRTTGFDYLRLFLALSILCWHSVVTSSGIAAGEKAFAIPYLRPLVTAPVPMFFVISGFLVAGSLERTGTLVSFLYLRVLRIFPALVVVSLLSALVLGPLFTSFAPAEYVADPKFWRYFWNLIGYIHYQLPGVFLKNPYPDITNAQLWTIPVEFDCYIALALIALVTGYRRRWFWAVILALMLAYSARQALRTDVSYHLAPGGLLIFFFLCGVGMYRLRAIIPFNGWLFAAAVASSFALFSTPQGMFFAVIPCTYVTVYLGLTSPRQVLAGDYSYGVYLCHFPIQQALVASFDWAKNPYLNLAASVVLAGMFAMGSWHLVEQRALRRKSAVKAIDAFVSRRMRRLAPTWSGLGAKAEPSV